MLFRSVVTSTAAIVVWAFICRRILCKDYYEPPIQDNSENKAAILTEQTKEKSEKQINNHASENDMFNGAEMMYSAKNSSPQETVFTEEICDHDISGDVPKQSTSEPSAFVNVGCFSEKAMQSETKQILSSSLKTVDGFSEETEEQSEKLFCRKCGAQLLLDSVFCNHCGTKVIRK